MVGDKFSDTYTQNNITYQLLMLKLHVSEARIAQAYSSEPSTNHSLTSKEQLYTFVSKTLAKTIRHLFLLKNEGCTGVFL